MRSLVAFGILAVMAPASSGCHHTAAEHEFPNSLASRSCSADAAREDALYRDPTVREHRPRLNHVVTLGGTSVVKSSPTATRTTKLASPVVIQNNVSVTNVTYVGGWGYGYGPIRPVRPPRPRPPKQSKPSAPSIQPGDDWPDVPDYGPQFPIAPSIAP